MRILLAEDQSSTRFAMRALIKQQSGWEVVGEVIEAGQLKNQIEKTHPDLVLLAWTLPELEVDEMLPVLRENYPGVAVIVLSGRPEVCQNALTAGASDFVSKADPPERLLEAIAAINSSQSDDQE
jgi:DNA-binding NarL/FixJ family response regulator